MSQETKGARVRVVLADDHPLVRGGIRNALSRVQSIALVGEASSGDEARRRCLEQRPDVVVLDLNMPGPPPATTVGYLRTHCPETRILILTAYDDAAYVRALVAAGVDGYVLKDEATQTVVQAIESVAQGHTWYSRRIVSTLAEPRAPRAPEDDEPALSPGELEVIREMGLGKTDAEIGAALHISERTVRRRLRAACRKLGAQNRVEAAVRAAQLGLLGG